jgi:heme/copper-type cytochrome/quinol oxidase subunit 2
VTFLDKWRKRLEDARIREAEIQLDSDEARQARREDLAARRRSLLLRQVSTDHLAGDPVAVLTTAAQERPEEPRWSAVKALVWSAAVTVLVLACLVWLLVRLYESPAGGPESALSLIFVSAAVVLILVVCTLTIVFKRLRLTNSEEAMGLPKGSIRAVIALMLILLFFIAAIFLYNTTRAAPVPSSSYRHLTGIGVARYNVIPTELIQSATSRTIGNQVVYDVVLYPQGPNTATSDDIAKQLITVLGTLVTAVAAFYFGANSVKDARPSDAAPGGGTIVLAQDGTPTPGSDLPQTKDTNAPDDQDTNTPGDPNHHSR